jgi:hypothetical protein
MVRGLDKRTILLDVVQHISPVPIVVVGPISTPSVSKTREDSFLGGQVSFV